MAIIVLKDVLKVTKAFYKLNHAERKEFLFQILPNELRPIIDGFKWHELLKMASRKDN